MCLRLGATGQALELEHIVGFGVIVDFVDININIKSIESPSLSFKRNATINHSIINQSLHFCFPVGLYIASNHGTVLYQLSHVV